ncbi:MAG: SPOR domain-containing protein [Campylobacterales bacterium]|nr:SPOR domain-containing protein [Campylobacterales bacterium]
MKKTVLLLLSASLSALLADNFIKMKKERPKQIEPTPTSYYQPTTMEEEPMMEKEPKMAEDKMEEKKMVKPSHKPAPKKMAAKPMMDEEYFWIQLGAFKFEEKAVNRVSLVKSSCSKVNIYQKSGLNKVVAGPFNSQEQAYSKLKDLRKIVKGAFLTQPENFK